MTTLKMIIHFCRVYRFQILIVGFYILLVSFGAWHHQPWRDEAHVWLVARDASPAQIIKLAPYEGTPVLWDFMLVPFAKSGFPYFTEAVLHLFLAVTAVTLFVFFAKTGRLTKVLFVFSYYMAYEYAVIARNYVHTAVFLFAIAALYRNRFSKPIWYGLLVFLLFQSNSLSFMGAFALTVLFGAEMIRGRKITGQRITAVAVMAVGAGLSYMQLVPPPDSVLHTHLGDFFQIFVALKESFFGSLNAFFTLNSLILIVLSTVTIGAVILVLVIFLWIARKHISLLFILIAELGWLFYIFVFKYGYSTYRHHGFILLFFIFILWLYNDAKSVQKDKNPGRIKSKEELILINMVNLLLLVSCAYNLFMYYRSYQYNFSGSKDMASFIRNNHLEKSVIVSYIGSDGEAVLPYFPGVKFWYPETGEFGTYIVYNQGYITNTDRSSDSIMRLADSVFSNEPHVLLLLSKPLPLELLLSSKYLIIHKSGAVHFWANETESFWLYLRDNTAQ